MVIVRSSRSDKYDHYLADVFVPLLQQNSRKAMEHPASPKGASRGYLNKNEEPNPQTDIYLNNLLLEHGHAVRMEGWSCEKAAIVCKERDE